jgi:cytochrome c2
MSMSPGRLLVALCVTVLAVALRPGAVASASDDEAGEVEVPEPVEVCLSCHTLDPEEPLLEGPTLWQVVGRPVASMPGFEYSTALRNRGGRWDRATLDGFLAAPQAFAPGTAMTLGGVRNAADRARVLDFLETLRPGGRQERDE